MRRRDSETADYDLAIIGLGAAGLTAAIFARRANPEARIIAFDGAPRIGAKILISGGGRCNVTHHAVAAGDFNGNRNAIAKVLRTFPVDQTVQWFAEMGVTLKREETGKLFPTTDRAKTVVDALVRECAGVELRTGTRVRACHPERSEGPGGEGRDAHDHATGRPSPPGPSLTLGMTLDDDSVIHARRLILATGGRSVPKTGSDGQGYSLARAFGHTTTETFPALVPLLLEPGHWMTTLSGTSLEAELSVRTETGRVLTRHRGSMLFTHFGLSGPVVLDVSRHWIASRGGTLVANLLPEETFESLDAAFVEEAKRNPRATVVSVLRRRLPERVLDAILPQPRLLSALAKEERRKVVRAVVEQPLPVLRDRGFDYAEVTAGGVPLTEIDLATMASRKCEGLFLCGEILDVDGRIGGFNFQWAWASGRLAGMHAARSLHSPPA